jgi:hypothetical protein
MELGSGEWKRMNNAYYWEVGINLELDWIVLMSIYK